VRTGKIRWVFHSIPHPGEFGYDTWPEDAFRTAGGVHNWSELTIDEARGIAFIPFGTGRFDFYGGNRKGANLFANSLVALDARTGKRLWHHQLVHHDLWDFDLPQAPKLLTLRRNGQNVDVVAQATKQGFIFVFDRVTGAPFFPIEERPVPQSDVPGEFSWPTQPYPTKPSSFAVQSFTEKDINPLLPPAEQDYLRQRLRNSRNEGLYTPPSLQGSISMPGHNGGANWGEQRRGSRARRVLRRLQEHAGHAAARAQQRRATRTGQRAWGRARRPDHHEGRSGAAARRGHRGGREGPGALHLAVRFHPEPGERHDRHRAAVVAPHRIRPEHGRHEMAGARRRRHRAGCCRHSGELGIAHAAWRTAGDRGGTGVRGHRLGSYRAGLRPGHGQVVWSANLPTGSEGVPASYEVNGPAVHRVSRRGGHGRLFDSVRQRCAGGAGRYIAYALPK
jgi:glucose dehydrogenase